MDPALRSTCTIAVLYALLRIDWIKLLHIPVQIEDTEPPSEQRQEGDDKRLPSL